MIKDKPVYLDYNASTPVDPKVVEVMLPYIVDNFGNPSSNHYYGIAAKQAIEKARKQVAEMLGCKNEEIIFTSGGTESNNFAIKGVAEAYRYKGNHIITSSIEHPAVSEVCKYLEENGFKITYLPVDEYGIVNPSDVKNAITSDTILISIMHANNEIGTIEPIKEIAEIVHNNNLLIHSDCAQSVGKIPVTIDNLNVDLLSIAGHKIYAPKGVGVLYIKNGILPSKYLHGADHELNRRAGTENVYGIVGIGKACELINDKFNMYKNHLLKMRNRFEVNIKTNLQSIKLNGHPEKRLPNTSSFSFRNIDANLMLGELKNIAASAGAACHSDSGDISGVLNAINLPLDYARGTIRFSVGRFTTEDEIDKASNEICEVVKRILPDSETDVNNDQTDDIKLTSYTQGLGCACKMRPQMLEKILNKIPAPDNANVLIGSENADDAAVYKIDDEKAIVQSVDFFTPIVDDPYHFGAVAAANSLSDIYAMGGKPLFALSIVGFPSGRLPIEVLEKILEGAREKANEAGVSIIGGHTIEDSEPKYGMAVSGIINPNQILTNKNAKPGDKLILTKPIGTGILTTALKKNMLDDKSQNELIKLMSQLNKSAAEISVEVGVNSCTDITGFGLLGHLLEMMKASGTSATINVNDVPLIDGVYDFAVSGIIPGGTKNNYEYTEAFTDYDEGIPLVQKMILNDAQTSGGLLISVDKTKADLLVRNLLEKNNKVALIGTVEEEKSNKIKILLRN